MVCHCHSRLLAFAYAQYQAWPTRQSARCRLASLTIRRPRVVARPCTSSCPAASWGTCATARRPSSSACAHATSPPGAPAAGANVADRLTAQAVSDPWYACRPAVSAFNRHDLHHKHCFGVPYYVQYSVLCRFVWWAACPLALAAASYGAFGVNGLIMLLGQAAGSVLLLEVVRAALVTSATVMAEAMAGLLAKAMPSFLSVCFACSTWHLTTAGLLTAGQLPGALGIGAQHAGQWQVGSLTSS